jgi:hypothetical protein
MASRPTLSVVKDAERRGAEQGGLSLREHCEKTAKSIMQSRTAADPICAEIASLAQPARSPFCPPLGGRRARAQKLINNLHDGHGVYAARILRHQGLARCRAKSHLRLLLVDQFLRGLRGGIWRAWPVRD